MKISLNDNYWVSSKIIADWIKHLFLKLVSLRKSLVSSQWTFCLYFNYSNWQHSLDFKLIFSLRSFSSFTLIFKGLDVCPYVISSSWTSYSYIKNTTIRIIVFIFNQLNDCFNAMGWLNIVLILYFAWLLGISIEDFYKRYGNSI